MTDPVATLFRVRILAPGFRLDESFGPVNDLKLAVFQNLTDQHRFVGMLVAAIHHNFSTRRQELLVVHRRTHLVHFNGAGLFNRLLPYIDAEVGCFHRIVRHPILAIRQIVLLAIGFEVRHEPLVLWRVHTLIVIPGGQMPDECTGIHAAQFVFRHAEGHDRGIFRTQALVAELLIERDVAVPVDGADDRRSSTGGKPLNLAANGLIILMVERGVFFLDIGRWYLLGQQHRAKNFVGRARIDIVCPEQVELLVAAPFGTHQVFDRRRRLLIDGRPGVEHISGTLFAFVLDGIEEHPIILFEDRQHRFAAD